MADRQLKKLKRRELLQMLLVQCEETERLQKELKDTQTELDTLQQGYERLKGKLNVKDERLNQKDAKIRELKDEIERIRSSREIEINEAGSIAEAALRLNGIFEAAQHAAEQYLMNVKRMSRKHGTEPAQQTDSLEIVEQELPEKKGVSGIYAIEDKKTACGQRIPYESGWKPIIRRKKLHG